MKRSHVLKVRLLCTLQHEFYEHPRHFNTGVSPGTTVSNPRSLAGNHYVYWAGSVSEISPLFSS